MENKQLNFDAPLLSTRKSTSLSTSDRQQKNRITKSPPIKISESELQEVTKMGNVPFIWEQIPGTPKNQPIRKLQIPTQPLNTPRLPPGGRRNSCRFELYPVKDHSALIEILRASVYGNRESDAESLDDIYSDAAETFESMSLCGLSDYQVTNTTNQPGKFKLDEQTGEFMMNRFLPAAKAAILDKPQYVSKKPSSVMPPEPIKLDKARKSSNHHRYYGNVVLSDYQYVVEDAKSKENGHDKHAKRFVKSSGSGFLPHLCVKNSLCIVKNMAVVKSNSATKHVTNDITRLTRKAYSGPIDKNCKDQNDTKRHHSGHLRGDPKTNQSTRFSHSSGPCNTGGGSSPFMASRKPYITTLRGMDTIRRVNPEQGNGQEGKLDIVDGKTEDKKEHSEVNVGNPLFPPLPKSPADSWLYQRVSSNVSSRNHGLRLNQDIGFYADKPVQKPHCSCTKWETIVKTSHSHRSNRSFSEELVGHIAH